MSVTSSSICVSVQSGCSIFTRSLTDIDSDVFRAPSVLARLATFMVVGSPNSWEITTSSGSVLLCSFSSRYKYSCRKLSSLRCIRRFFFSIFRVVASWMLHISAFKFSRFCKETIACRKSKVVSALFKFSRFCKETIAVAASGVFSSRFKFSRFCKETIARLNL